MSGHTPGPWTAEGPIHGKRERSIEIGAETPAGHLSVAWIHGLNPGDDEEAAWADARLIAAAPDLLEVAKLALKVALTRPRDGGQLSEDLEELLLSARAALAKAKPG